MSVPPMSSNSDSELSECIVPCCSNTKENEPNKIFIRVPFDSDQRLKWLNALNIAYIRQFPSRFCCEDHFNLAEDCDNWMYFKTVGLKLKLKRSILPHRFITSPPAERLPSQYSASEKDRKIKTLARISSNRSHNMRNWLPNSNEELFFLTEELERVLIQSMEIKNKVLFNLPGKLNNFIMVLAQSSKSTEFAILLSLKKLLFNETSDKLANDFLIKERTVTEIFKDTVPKMASILKSFIFWPKLIEIEKNLPVAFKNKYKNVKSLVECFEIKLETSIYINPLEQYGFYYSNYRYNTLKFLISCTPDGFVNFVSETYPGRISAENIIIQSRFLENLPTNVDIMADSSFKLIEYLLTPKKCCLLTPFTLCGNKVLSKNDLHETKCIRILSASMERVIKKLKSFKILTENYLSPTMFDFINEIIVILCGIINFKRVISTYCT